jgi:hypothetical protein
MKLWKNHTDEAIDRAAREIRDEKIDGAAERAAADRVWSRLSSGETALQAGRAGVHAGSRLRRTARGRDRRDPRVRDSAISFLVSRRRLSPARAPRGPREGVRRVPPR